MEALKVPTVVGSGEGVSPFPVGGGRGSELSIQIFVFSPLKWCILMHSGGRLTV